jgi:ABC-2 type transport system ATP-binding protein
MNGRYAIDVKNVNKSFGKHHVVKNLSLQVAPGEIFGFLGPNGSGKTTSIRMLCGLLTPDSGTGDCLGYDIIKQSEEIKRQTGYMTQSFSMWSDLTVYENLEFVTQIYAIANHNQAIIEIMQQFNLTDKKSQLAGSLSGGWKQRLALAACMLHKPKLLLLDEPTAGIDPKARRDFWEELHILATQGISILVSTHYMDEAERCNKLAYIFNGTLITHGSAHEIIAQHQIFTYSIYGKNLSDLSLKLKNSEGVTQSISFGESLHVSGIDKTILLNTLDKLKASGGYVITEIPTSLEDIFVYLMTNANK